MVGNVKKRDEGDWNDIGAVANCGDGHFADKQIPTLLAQIVSYLTSAPKPPKKHHVQSSVSWEAISLASKRPGQYSRLAKRVEPTWGFTIYRTIYTPESDAAFADVVNLITVYLKHGFYKQYKSLRENPRTVDQADEAIFDELWAVYKPRVMDDATHFDGLSINPLGTQFEAWAEEQGRADKFPSYRMFIVVDEESFNSLQNAPIPAELPTGTKRRIAHYVKLVEVGQEHDHDSLFPGWMKCSLKGLWDIWRNMQDGDYMRSSYMMVHERREFIEVLS